MRLENFSWLFHIILSLKPNNNQKKTKTKQNQTLRSWHNFGWSFLFLHQQLSRVIKFPFLLWKGSRKRGNCILVPSRRRTTEKPEGETRGRAQRKLRSHSPCSHFLPCLSIPLPHVASQTLQTDLQQLGSLEFLWKNFVPTWHLYLEKARFLSKLENTTYTCENYYNRFSSTFSPPFFFFLKREPGLAFGLCFQLSLFPLVWPQKR